MAQPSAGAGPWLRVLRVCSVYQLPVARFHRPDARFDPVGGTQTHTEGLTRSLDDLGVAQTVLTSRLSGPTGRQQVGRWSQVRRVGLRTSRWRQLWSLPALVLALSGARPDLVHGHQGEDVAALAISWLAARRHRCPLVVTIHCSVRHTMQVISLWSWATKLAGGWVERRVLRRADAVITLTHAAAARAVVDGARAVRVIPSGVWPQPYRTPAPAPLPHIPHPRIGYVGRLAPQKSVETLLQALPVLATSHAQLVLVGDGPDRERLTATAARLGVTDRVHLLGFLPHARIAAVLQHLDVLVLPSRYEELGSVVLEAFAAGVPVVASAVGGIPEVIADRVTGLLFPVGDPAALAEQLDTVLSDPALAGRLAARAQRDAGRHAWPELAGLVVTLYRQTLGRGGVAPRAESTALNRR